MATSGVLVAMEGPDVRQARVIDGQPARVESLEGAILPDGMVHG
jgi:hypothetical protein